MSIELHCENPVSCTVSGHSGAFGGDEGCLGGPTARSHARAVGCRSVRLCCFPVHARQPMRATCAGQPHAPLCDTGSGEVSARPGVVRLMSEAQASFRDFGSMCPASSSDLRSRAHHEHMSMLCPTPQVRHVSCTAAKVTALTPTVTQRAHHACRRRACPWRSAPRPPSRRLSLFWAACWARSGSAAWTCSWRVTM